MDFKQKQLYLSRPIDGQKINQTRAEYLYGKLDIIVSSGELKKLILERIKLLKYNKKKLCKEAKVNHDDFLLYYLENPEPSMTNFYVCQEDVISVAKVLGIDVRLTIVKRDIDRVASEMNPPKVRINNEFITVDAAERISRKGTDEAKEEEDHRL